MMPIEVYDQAGDRLLTAQSVAALVRCKVSTLDAYLSRGQMPAPVGAVGRTRLWSSAVIGSWLVTRGHDQIPAELRALPRWTRHDNKRPIMVTGKPASSTDPATWTTYLEAKASTTGDGLGVMLDGDGIVGVDLDHCVVDGVISPGALAILDLLADTYAELSPSGHGLRVFCRATVTKGRRFTSHRCAIEVYGSGRFLTVTGNRLPDRPRVLADHHAAVRGLMPHAPRRMR
jgi:hypothetical protein